MLAREMNLVKLGRIALDGTKIKANAGKHKALSYAHAQKIEAKPKEEVKALTDMAEVADQNSAPDGMDVPAEIARREVRLAALAKAKATIEARAEERYRAEQRAFEEKRARRQAQREEGEKPRGKEPEPPQPGPRDKDQVNLTDEESRIMRLQPARGEILVPSVTLRDYRIAAINYSEIYRPLPTLQAN